VQFCSQNFGCLLQGGLVTCVLTPTCASSCRASEALKQNGDVNRRESQAAADAAHGLVGLAAAAAADAPTDPAAAAAAAAVTLPTRSGSLAAFTLTGATSDMDTLDGEEDGVFSRERSEVPGSSSKLQQQQPSLQQQAEQPQEQQEQQAEVVPAAAGLAVRQLSPRAVQPSDDGVGVDAAAVEAAEGLHMLMKCASSFTGRRPDSRAAAAAAVAAVAEADAAAVSLKRKLEAPAADGVEQEGAAAAAAAPAAGLGDVQQQQQQLAEALAAAAGCSAEASSDIAAAQQQQQQSALLPASSAQQQQQLAWPAAAATPFQAAANLPALQLSHIPQQLVEQLQQQHAVVSAAAAAAAAGFTQPQQSASLAAALQLQHYNSASGLAAAAAAAASMPAASALSTGSMPVSSSAAYAVAGGGEKPAKRQRLNGVQMAELVASVRHHVQANPERYTHCVIRDMKEKYPDLELNMGQVREHMIALRLLRVMRVQYSTVLQVRRGCAVSVHAFFCSFRMEVTSGAQVVCKWYTSCV
jgi:hypothetical protein